MIFSRSGWWMMASSSAIAQFRPHPKTARNQPATIDQRHLHTHPLYYDR
jgi:hypothetical protein